MEIWIGSLRIYNPWDRGENSKYEGELLHRSETTLSQERIRCGDVMVLSSSVLGFTAHVESRAHQPTARCGVELGGKILAPYTST